MKNTRRYYENTKNIAPQNYVNLTNEKYRARIETYFRSLSRRNSSGKE